jgi:hypothetical protein
MWMARNGILLFIFFMVEDGVVFLLAVSSALSNILSSLFMVLSLIHLLASLRNEIFLKIS